MTREEIENFSDEEPYCFGYCVGCIDGLKAADAEPNLESLWYDAGEKPKGAFNVLCDSLNNRQMACRHRQSVQPFHHFHQ